MRTYLRAEAAVVHKTKEEFGGLSNMASGYPLHIHGVRILTSEALYQACRFPYDPDLQKEIIGQHSPMTAKMKGKPHLGRSRPDWDQVRFKVMRWCLRVKLAQHYESFGELLLSTGVGPIVELSRKDVYWGAKVSGPDDCELVGMNVLGRLLMELRELLRTDSDSRLRAVPPLNIPDFLLLGKPIGVVSSSEFIPEEHPQPGLF